MEYMPRRNQWFSRFAITIAIAVAALATLTMTVGLNLFSQPQVLAQQTQQANCQAFPETGKRVCGRFLTYWQQHGGLPQQGFPISNEFQEKSDIDGKTYTVQYFERAVFELHPENATPNDVLLSLLGSILYKQKYPNGAPELPPDMNPVTGLSFPQTGKEIKGVFLTYWKEHGGLAQQGYPITNLMREKSELDGKEYTVQYFERAVFELHPEKQPLYDVLLSQLGTFQFKRKYSSGGPPSATPTVTTPSAKLYDHAADYSWVAGQLRQEGSCWIVTYVSPLVDIAADQYNNQFTLLPSSNWNPTYVKSGEWVMVRGHPTPGTAPASGCSTHGYVVDRIQANTMP